MLTQLSADEYDRKAKMPIGVLHVSIEELEIDHGIVFVEDLDDLNYFRWAALRVPSGATFALLKYRDSSSGVQIFGDPENPSMDELALELRLPPSIFTPSGDR
jgi:hypothetical protein